MINQFAKEHIRRAPKVAACFSLPVPATEYILGLAHGMYPCHTLILFFLHPYIKQEHKREIAGPVLMTFCALPQSAAALKPDQPRRHFNNLPEPELFRKSNDLEDAALSKAWPCFSFAGPAKKQARTREHYSLEIISVSAESTHTEEGYLVMQKFSGLRQHEALSAHRQSGGTEFIPALQFSCPDHQVLFQTKVHQHDGSLGRFACL